MSLQGLGNPNPTADQIRDRQRVMRISAGSGRYPGEVVQLLDEHKRFSKMVGKMGKLGVSVRSCAPLGTCQG
eukprot:SAG11_NODE_57_length_19200_cov_18.288417_11_plen_72_part_00